MTLDLVVGIGLFVGTSTVVSPTHIPTFTSQTATVSEKFIIYAFFHTNA